jgi:hypothetical protein
MSEFGAMKGDDRKERRAEPMSEAVFIGVERTDDRALNNKTVCDVAPVIPVPDTGENDCSRPKGRLYFFNISYIHE